MSTWRITHEQEPDLVVVDFAQPFNFENIDFAAQEIGDSDSSRLFNFVDCTGLSPTTTELLSMGKKAAAWSLADQTRIAFVAGSQTDAGLLRIVISRFSEQVMKVFLSATEARRWLSARDTGVSEVIGRSDHLPVRLRGTINLDDVLQTQQNIRQQPEYYPGQPLLWDLREASLTESLAEVQDLAVFIAGNHNRDRSGYRSAILVDSHIMDLLIREMAKVSEWPSEDIRVFRSYKEAVGWLGAPE
tara:strand:+ start:9415 stop:10149 length:735 start_codon:yes stop_codon:yes gene_type:complete